MTHAKDGEGRHAGEPQNDNAPFDPKAWRKKYMRKYMQARRDRIRAEKAKAKGEEP